MSENISSFYCNICNKSYSYEGNYLKHMQTHNEVDDPRRFPCPLCGRLFSRKANMLRHSQSYCKADEMVKLAEKITKECSEKIENKLSQKFEESMKATQELKVNVDKISKNPQQINNNILQVMCVGQKDNYLDILTEQCGFEQALEYVKNCALSDVNGDVRLIQKIYFDGNRPADYPIRFLDKKRGKLEFIDENRDLIDDPTGYLLAQRLGNSLQSTYLKGVNYLIERNLNNRLCPNKFLEQYDIMTWNQHIYDLSDCQRRHKLVKLLASDR